MTPSNSPTTSPRRDSRRAASRLIPALGVLGALLSAGCAPVPPPEEPPGAPQLPIRIVEGADHYRVVDDGTLVYARVFRGGSLAAFGHNHVVVFPGVRGDVFLADTAGSSLFDVVVSPARATVDPEDLRRRQGPEFRTDVSEDARGRTRLNMLGEEVLGAERHPRVLVSSATIEGSFEKPRVTLSVTLKEVTRRVTIPVSVDRGDGRLVAKGRFELLQSDFGIEPFSTLGGALRVEDRVEVVFTVAAAKAG